MKGRKHDAPRGTSPRGKAEYTGGNRDVAREAGFSASGFARGGGVDIGSMKSSGDANIKSMKAKRDPHVVGRLSKLRLDRPGRKRGGRVGAEMSPLSSAGKSSD